MSTFVRSIKNVESLLFIAYDFFQNIKRFHSSALYYLVAIFLNSVLDKNDYIENEYLQVMLRMKYVCISEYKFLVFIVYKIVIKWAYVIHFNNKCEVRFNEHTKLTSSNLLFQDN